MPTNTLYGYTVSSTFQFLVQYRDGLYYDGFGNLLNLGGGTSTIGPQGDIGPQGATGPQGQMGNGISWQGDWDNMTIYYPNELVSYNGSVYICKQPSSVLDGPGVPPYTSPDITSIVWDLFSLASIGPQGLTGYQGPTGPGSNYYIQDSSPTASINSGDRWYDLTTGLEYVWIYDGDSYQWVSPGAGPQGFQGSNGATGPQGFQGSNGATGPQGSNGSNGSTGSTGPQGFQGSNGSNGATGPQGSQGSNGATGPQGSNGSNGATGPQGLNGSNGLNGATGPQGVTGPAGSGSGLTGSGSNTRVVFWNGTQSLSSTTRFTFVDATSGTTGAQLTIGAGNNTNSGGQLFLGMGDTHANAGAVIRYGTSGGDLRQWTILAFGLSYSAAADGGSAFNYSAADRAGSMRWGPASNVAGNQQELQVICLDFAVGGTTYTSTGPEAMRFKPDNGLRIDLQNNLLTKAYSPATALLDLGASRTSRASLRIRSGVSPTTPNDGDVWYNGTNLIFRGASTSRFLVSGTGTINSIPYYDSTLNNFTNNINFTYDTSSATPGLQGLYVSGGRSIIFAGVTTVSTATQRITVGTGYIQFSHLGGVAPNRSIEILATGGSDSNTLSLKLDGVANTTGTGTASEIIQSGERIFVSKQFQLYRGTSMIPQGTGVIGSAGFAAIGSSANDAYPRWSNYAGGVSSYYHIPVIETVSNGNVGSTGFTYSVNTGDLFTQITNVTIGNTSSETSIISGTIIGSKDLVASTNTINPHFVVGKRYRFTSQGSLSTKSGPTGTVQIKVKIGGTIIAQSNAVSMDKSMTDAHFSIDFTFTVRSVGASGVMMCNGLFDHVDVDMGSPESIRIKNVTGATVSTTANRTLDVTYQWETADVSNTITILEASLEQINPTERSLSMIMNGTIATIKTT